ncbi:tigger transposable element-derived protein 4-like [Homalodisca vitripennis]|uniref:tigger transposable element-derived protein 4-like n=1 Tax=Homalodisca vitripennis TaxID=197043 RepID=UPI001EEBE447|nr:tigger transposable element-derived protein 4-like [Homalodisca vitripennis]
MKNIKIEFLPPNTTSKLQPLDQGIIKNFKVHYRKEVVRLFLRDPEDKNPTKISILDAMWMASKAWNNVTENTIKNCFKKSGFKQQVDEEEESVVEDCSIVETDNSELASPVLWRQVTQALTLEGLSFEDFVAVDDELATCGKLSDADIIASVSKDTSVEDSVVEDGEDDDGQRSRNA